MNQRTLQVVWLTTNGNVYAGGATTSESYDLVANTATTQGWTYGQVGRREMKLSGFVVSVFTGTMNCTGFWGYLISGSTGAAAGTWNLVPNSTFMVGTTNALTTGGAITPIHFYTNDRYLRAIYNVTGATTASIDPDLFTLVEQRAS